MFPGGMAPAGAQDTGAGASGSIIASAADKRERAGMKKISYLCIRKGLKFQ